MSTEKNLKSNISINWISRNEWIICMKCKVKKIIKNKQKSRFQSVHTFYSQKPLFALFQFLKTNQKNYWPIWSIRNAISDACAPFNGQQLLQNIRDDRIKHCKHYVSSIVCAKSTRHSGSVRWYSCQNLEYRPNFQWRVYFSGQYFSETNTWFSHTLKNDWKQKIPIVEAMHPRKCIPRFSTLLVESLLPFLKSIFSELVILDKKGVNCFYKYNILYDLEFRQRS